MPLDSVSIARLQLVYPPLRDKVITLADQLEGGGAGGGGSDGGVVIRVVQALRSWAEQDTLYSQGRNGNAGPVVTNCKGGYSYHNFGLAVDCVPSQFGPGEAYNPDWNSAHPSWQAMIAKGQALGLAAGAVWRTFPDAPHLQLSGRFPEGAPSDEVREIFKDKGMQGVWDEVERSLAV